MRWTPDQLAALIAIVDRGTFDAAATALQVTPSAVSQRVRALESAVGQVLVRRTVPATPTEAGRVLLRLARQVEHLSASTRTSLTGESGEAQVLPIAVNADSLAVWFAAVLREVADWSGVALRLEVEDQAHTTRLLRDGEVLAAVTSEATPVAGCRVERLGSLRYFPAATPALVERFTSSRDKGFAWSRAPMVNYHVNDALQWDYLERLGAPAPTIVHQVPTSAEFATSVAVGLGWGMLPEAQLDPLVAAGTVVVINDEPSDVALFWQYWRLDTPLLARLTGAVVDHGRIELRQT